MMAFPVGRAMHLVRNISKFQRTVSSYMRRCGRKIGSILDIGQPRLIDIPIIIQNAVKLITAEPLLHCYWIYIGTLKEQVITGL